MMYVSIIYIYISLCVCERLSNLKHQWFCTQHLWILLVAVIESQDRHQVGPRRFHMHQETIAKLWHCCHSLVTMESWLRVGCGALKETQRNNRSDPTETETWLKPLTLKNAMGGSSTKNGHSKQKWIYQPAFRLQKNVSLWIFLGACRFWMGDGLYLRRRGADPQCSLMENN